MATSRSKPSEVHGTLPAPRIVCGAYFRFAAILGWIVALLQVAALFLGTFALVSKSSGIPLAVALTAIAYVAALLRLAADWSKGRADLLLRAFEFEDAFGATDADRVALVMTVDAPRLLLWLASKEVSLEPYFASEASHGPRRCAENTLESSWWTARLARTMVRFELFRLAAFGLVALLLYRAAAGGGGTTGSAIANAIVMFLLTLGPLRRVSEFTILANGADRVCDSAIGMLKSGEVSYRQEAARLLSEYQLIRKGAPLIPSILWSIRRPMLSAAWRRLEQSLGLEMSAGKPKQL